MVFGVFGFLAGLYICWWPWREVLPPVGFSIGISIGGIAQMILQTLGYKDIKRFQRIQSEIERLTSPSSSSPPAQDVPNNQSNLLPNDGSENTEELIEQLKEEKVKALNGHISNMISLFVVACGVPAAMRIADFLAIDGTVALIVCIVAMIFVAECYSKKMRK